MKFPPVRQPIVPLREDETIVIQADDPNYDRGLLVTLTGKGGYDMAYWYKSPDLIYPAEVKIDGKSITKDGTIVHIGYHPELARYQSAGLAKKIPKISKSLFVLESALALSLFAVASKSKGMTRNTALVSAAYLAYGALMNSDQIR